MDDTSSDPFLSVNNCKNINFCKFLTKLRYRNMDFTLFPHCNWLQCVRGRNCVHVIYSLKVFKPGNVTIVYF